MSHRVRMSMPRRGDRGVWTSHSVVRQKNNVKYTRRNTPWSRTAAGRGLRGCHTLALHDASMDVLRADASRLVGPAAESLAEEAAAAMLRVQEMLRMKKRRSVKGLDLVILQGKREPKVRVRENHQKDLRKNEKKE